MLRIRVGGRAGVFSALALLFPTANAQVFSTITEWQVPTPNCGPRNLAVAGTGVYFTEQNAGKVGFLDTNTNLMTEWILPGGSFPHGLAAAGTMVAFAEPNGDAGRIAMLDAGAGTLIEWTIPQISAALPTPYQVSLLGDSIFFTDPGEGAIGVLDTSTNLVTEWVLPGAAGSRNPNGIVAVSEPDSTIDVWVADAAAQKITLLRPAENTLIEWTTPNAGAQHLDVRDGMVSFADLNANLAGVLDPAQNTLREWRVSMPSAQPLYIAWLSPGVLAFTEYAAGQVATLNTALGPFSQTAVAPIQTTVAPILQGALSESSSLFAVRTLTVPVTTPASFTVFHGFTEYPLRPPSSQPAGVAIGDGTVLFTEFGLDGNRIGRLR